MPLSSTGSQRAAPPAADCAERVTLLLVGEDHADSQALHRRLLSVAERFGQAVGVVRLEPDELMERHPRLHQAWHAGSATVFVMRGAELVGSAMGAGLPTRELHRVVSWAVC